MKFYDFDDIIEIVKILLKFPIQICMESLYEHLKRPWPVIEYGNN